MLPLNKFRDVPIPVHLLVEEPGARPLEKRKCLNRTASTFLHCKKKKKRKKGSLIKIGFKVFKCQMLFLPRLTSTRVGTSLGLAFMCGSLKPSRKKLCFFKKHRTGKLYKLFLQYIISYLYSRMTCYKLIYMIDIVIKMLFILFACLLYNHSYLCKILLVAECLTQLCILQVWGWR